MAKYDISDPYDISTMEALFSDYSDEEWEEFIEFAKSSEHKKTFSFRDVGMLITASKKSGRGNRLSPKQLSLILSIVERIEELQSDDSKNEKTESLLKEQSFNVPPSHITLRVAWHDNKWNGCICDDPENNTYCNGFNSLLSERIRRRKAENIQNEIENKGKSLSSIDYQPPCFWSVNLFGENNLRVTHDNPAAPDLEYIEEELPAKSMLSWPFAVSFSRTKKEIGESGAYPKNLGEIRIPWFNAKIHEGKSIAFMYAKFSNPLTEEEQQYLVVGAGIVDNKQKASDIPHFGPESEIEKIRNKPYKNYKNRNFPSMNWAMQFSFDDYSTVRMPYHEYIERAEKLDDEAKDGFFDKIKVAITEPELEWCFKYVAMDIGDDEAIYILTKMRKALISCNDDGIVAREEMQDRIEKVEELLKFAWSSRSYFPGFVSISRVLLNQQDEPDFKLEKFYEDFKEDSEQPDEELTQIINDPLSNAISKPYVNLINELKDRIDQWGITKDQFLILCMLNLKPFQFQRILFGKLKLPEKWIRNFDEDVTRTHNIEDIIKNPYILFEDYEYWQESHDDVYGEERDAPIDLFKIDIAFFPDSRYVSRIELQRSMSFVDKRRIRAIVLRHLNTLENKGDCFADAEALQKAMVDYPLYYELDTQYKVPDNFFYPINSDYAIHFKEDPKKLESVEANDTMYYYLAQVYEAEKYIESKFLELLREDDLNESFEEIETDINDSVVTLKNDLKEAFEEELFRAEREELYKNIFAKRLFVVTGNAGSGKSHEILKVITHLEENEEQKYLLLAPTGKAALRLSSESKFPNVQASTIDKFITSVRNGTISQAEVKQFKNVIIDETSMVDLLKFQRLLKLFNFKEPSFKRLILIGDPNQLPAIGYGRVLSDLISYLRSNKKYWNNFIQLDTNCRSELKENDVLRLAEAFKQKGELEPDLNNKFKNREEDISAGFRTRYWSHKDELYDHITAEFKKISIQNGYEGDLNFQLNKMLGLTGDGDLDNGNSTIENFQIITPYHAQYSGASKINDFIQTKFKADLDYEYRKGIYKKSDKLIRTKNYYEDEELLLSNGTLGLIMGGKNEKFYYDGIDKTKNISFYNIRKFEQEFFELAYAITVHKSQGSGFNHLFVVIPERYGLLSKELVYTALTRTKKTITLFLQTTENRPKNVLEIAMGRTFSAARRTSLMLEKPYQYYDLEPEEGVFVESRIELLIYHLLMQRRKELGEESFSFEYEKKPIINGKEINIKTDFTVYCNNKTWYWEHLGLLGQRKYTWTWLNVKKKTYQEAGIWDNIITTDESKGINPSKLEEIIDIIVNDNVQTEDKYNQYSNHHYYLR